MSAPWMKQSACSTVGGDWWFPEVGQPATMARAICDRCDVSRECLEYALKHRISYGIWGGLSASVRNQIIKRREKESRKEAA